jgi:hypothetical protein
MTTAGPLSPESRRPCSQGEPVVDEDDEETSWLLAAAVIEARRQGQPRPQEAVMGLLAEMTVERGAGTITRAALGLADVAATLLDLYAGSLDKAPQTVLGDVLATLRGNG